MDKESKFTKDSDGYTAVRVVLGSESLPASDKDWMFARDENGNIAVRVVLGAGGGGITHNLGLFEDLEALEEVYPEGNPGDYALLASTDTFWVWDEDTSAWVDTDRKGQVSSVNGKTGDVTIGKSSTITLTAADWSSDTQTVNVTGMTATSIVFVSPVPSDQSDYTSAGILCTAQAAGTLTFSCDTTPANDIDVNVVML